MAPIDISRLDAGANVLRECVSGCVLHLIVSEFTVPILDSYGYRSGSVVVLRGDHGYSTVCIISKLKICGDVRDVSSRSSGCIEIANKVRKNAGCNFGDHNQVIPLYANPWNAKSITVKPVKCKDQILGQQLLKEYFTWHNVSVMKGDFIMIPENHYPPVIGECECKVIDIALDVSGVTTQSELLRGSPRRDQILSDLYIDLKDIGIVTEDTKINIALGSLTEEEMTNSGVSMVGLMNNDVFTVEHLQNAEKQKDLVMQLEACVKNAESVRSKDEEIKRLQSLHKEYAERQNHTMEQLEAEKAEKLKLKDEEMRKLQKEHAEKQANAMMQLNQETAEKLRFKNEGIDEAQKENAKMSKQLILIEESAKEKDERISNNEEDLKSKMILILIAGFVIGIIMIAVIVLCTCLVCVKKRNSIKHRADQIDQNQIKKSNPNQANQAKSEPVHEPQALDCIVMHTPNEPMAASHVLKKLVRDTPLKSESSGDLFAVYDEKDNEGVIPKTTDTGVTV